MNNQQMDSYQADDQNMDDQQNDQYMDDQQDADEDMGSDHGDMVFVSVDGDSIGSEVGSAILSDDLDRLHQISQAINHGQNLLMDWAEQNGGNVISAGGDEAILQVPSSSLKWTR